MKRIIVHWTAGTYEATEHDRKFYHYLIDGDNKIVKGRYSVSDNESVADGVYAAHTAGTNKDSIGVSLCGMAGAKENPFNAGKYPLKNSQWRTMLWLVARLCKEYKIPVTNKTLLTHAEVQSNLGNPQKGKWDITRLPFDNKVIGAKAVGDLLRKEVKSIMEKT